MDLNRLIFPNRHSLTHSLSVGVWSKRGIYIQCKIGIYTINFIQSIFLHFLYITFQFLYNYPFPHFSDICCCACCESIRINDNQNEGCTYFYSSCNSISLTTFSCNNSSIHYSSIMTLRQTLQSSNAFSLGFI